MKRSLSSVLAVLLTGSALASAATLISKQQAEQDALRAVGGGTVTQRHSRNTSAKLKPSRLRSRRLAVVKYCWLCSKRRIIRQTGPWM